jgi:hypothetical protein
MEVFSGVAAAITLGAELLRLSHLLSKMIKTMKTARRDMTKLVAEMETFADLYNDFYGVCIADRKRGTASTKRLVAWIMQAITAFKTLLDRVRALAGETAHGVLDTLAAHVKWYFSENDVKCLRASLSVARESMRGFSNIAVIEKVDGEMELIRAAIARGDGESLREMEDGLGMSAREKLRELEQMRCVFRRV